MIYPACPPKDVHPRDALHSTSTAFTVCLDHMMGLLSDPLCSPGIGRKVTLVGGSVVDSSGGVIRRRAGLEDKRAEEGVGESPGGGVSFGGDGHGNRSDGDGTGGGDDNENGNDPKVAAALEKALLLLEDADMMRRMLEKLLEFDEKKYTTMFQATGILDQVLQPLLKRMLTLNVGGCPGAGEIWRGMCCHPGVVGGGFAAGVGSGNAGGKGGEEVGWARRVEETGALALVSRATRLLCSTLALLLGSSQGVCRQFRALRIHDTLYSIIRRVTAGAI